MLKIAVTAVVRKEIVEDVVVTVVVRAVAVVNVVVVIIIVVLVIVVAVVDRSGGVPAGVAISNHFNPCHNM